MEIAVCDGDMVIDVLELTPLSPDIAAAEALMLKQYDSLKTANASTVSPQPSG